MAHRALRSPAPRGSGSAASSRPVSRGPNADSGELFNEINFGNLDELISERLNTLLSLESAYSPDKQTEAIKLRLKSIPDLIKTLQKPRNEVSTTDRELLLNQLFHLIVKNTDLEVEYDDYEYENDLVVLLKIFQSSKSSNESILSIRTLTSFIIANIENAGIVFSEEPSLRILPMLEKKIIDPTIPQEVKQYLIYSYSSIALAIYDEAGGFGVDGIIEYLNETFLGLLDDQAGNAELITSIVYGLGNTLTLMIGSANLNELIETIIDPIVEFFLSTDTLSTIKPIAMLIGLCYEIYNYNDSPDDDLSDFDPGDDILPHMNTYEIKSRLERLMKNTNKKVSKNDKRKGISLFKDVLTTINFYSDKRNRLNKMLNRKNDEIDGGKEEEFVLSHIKLSKSRSLAVKSWFSFFRLIQMKWVFGDGIHTQLANNSQISKIVRDKPTDGVASQFSANSGGNGSQFWQNQTSKRVSEKKKQKSLEGGRRAKLNVSLDQAGLLSDDD